MFEIRNFICVFKKCSRFKKKDVELREKTLPWLVRVTRSGRYSTSLSCPVRCDFRIPWCIAITNDLSARVASEMHLVARGRDVNPPPERSVF